MAVLLRICWCLQATSVNAITAVCSHNLCLADDNTHLKRIAKLRMLLSVVLIAAAENVTAENACCDGVACSAAATCKQLIRLQPRRDDKLKRIQSN